MTNCV